MLEMIKFLLQIAFKMADFRPFVVFGMIVMVLTY